MSSRFQLAFALFLAFSGPAEAAFPGCLIDLVNWFSGPPHTEQSLSKAVARAVSGNSRLQDILDDLSSSSSSSDAFVGSWMVANVDGLELIPQSSLAQLGKQFARPGMRFAMAHTRGTIQVRYRDQIRSFWSDLLMPGEVAGIYTRLPWPHILIGVERKADRRKISSELLVQFHIRFYLQLLHRLPQTLGRVEALYRKRMMQLGLGQMAHFDFTTRLANQQASGYSTRQGKEFLEKKAKLFAHPSQALGPLSYYSYGAVAYFEAPERLLAADPELFALLGEFLADASEVVVEHKPTIIGQ